MQVQALKLITEEYEKMIWYPDEEGQLLYAANVLSPLEIDLENAQCPKDWPLELWLPMLELDHTRRLVLATTMFTRQLQRKLDQQTTPSKILND